MNAEAVRARIVATLSPDANVRRAAELELKAVRLHCLLHYNAMLCYVALGYSMLCYVMPCHVMLRFAFPCRTAC